MLSCGSTDPKHGSVPQGLAKSMGTIQSLDEFNTNFSKLKKGMTPDEVDSLIPLGIHKRDLINIQPNKRITVQLPRAILSFTSSGLQQWQKKTGINN